MAMEWTEMVFRTLVIFVVLYVAARVLNKKLISQMTFFDFLAGITIGSLTASIILSTDLGLGTGVGALLLFSALVLLIDYTVVKSFRLRKVFNSEPTILVKNGKVLEEGMEKVRFNVDELLTRLRKKGYFYLDEVDTAMLETDGSVSVLAQPQYQPVVRQDMKMTAPYRGRPEAFVVDGHILESGLKAMGKDRQWAEKTLKERGIRDLEEVVAAQIDAQGNVYIDTREDGIKH